MLKDELKMNFYFIPKAMPNAGVVVDRKYLYYTSANTNMLIKYDIYNKRNESVYYIPENEDKAYLFLAIYQYENKLFILPNNATKIYVFDMQNESFAIMKENILCEYSKGMKFRETVCEENIVWISSAQKKHILKLDMKHEQLSEINLTYCDCSNNMGQPIMWRNHLYVPSIDDKYGVEIDIKTEQVSSWRAGANLAYGCIYDGEIYYTSSVKNVGGIWKKDIYTGEEQNIVSFYEDGEIRNYRYWRYQVSCDCILFLPCESNNIMSYNIKKKEVEYINNYIPYNEKVFYRKSFIEHGIFGLFQIDNGYISLMPVSHCIVLLSSDYEVIEVYEHNIDEEIVLREEIKRGYVFEKKARGIDSLLEISKKNNGNQDNITNVGALIHCEIIK